MKTVSPCTKCEKRHVGCHAECKAFAEWQEIAAVEKQRKDADRRREHLLNDYYLSAKDNMRKKHSSRRKKK